jgi:hypothetical protein
MENAGAQVIDMIFGRWRSQILNAGVKLGVFHALASGPKRAISVASALDVGADLLYRLISALGSLGRLHEDNSRTFTLTSMGEWLCRDHPHTLRGMALLEEGSGPDAVWKHLPALIPAGQQAAFVREYGQPVFEYAVRHPSSEAVCNEAMRSYASFDGHDHLFPVGRDGVEKRLRTGFHVPVQHDLTVLVEDADIHGPGVQVDATVKLMWLGVEAYEVSSSPGEFFPIPAYHRGMRRRGPQ